MAKKLLQFTAWKIPRKNDRVSATTEPFRGRRKRQPKGGRWRALRDVARPKMADSLGDHRVVRLAIDIQSFHFDRVSSLLHVNLTFKCRHAFMYIYIYITRDESGTESKRNRPIYREMSRRQFESVSFLSLIDFVAIEETIA